MNKYIENHEEIRKITDNGRPCDIGVQLDIFDAKHGYKKDKLARAQYMQKFYPQMLSKADADLLSADK